MVQKRGRRRGCLEGDKRGLPRGIKGKLKNMQKNELIEIIKINCPMMWDYLRNYGQESP